VAAGLTGAQFEESHGRIDGMTWVAMADAAAQLTTSASK
jgi:hypothetical protein